MLALLDDIRRRLHLAMLITHELGVAAPVCYNRSDATRKGGGMARAETLFANAQGADRFDPRPVLAGVTIMQSCTSELHQSQQ